MKLTSITMAYGRTINMGNYESLRIEVIASADVDTDDNKKETATMLRGWLRNRVDEAVKSESEHING